MFIYERYNRGSKEEKYILMFLLFYTLFLSVGLGQCAFLPGLLPIMIHHHSYQDEITTSRLAQEYMDMQEELCAIMKRKGHFSTNDIINQLSSYIDEICATITLLRWKSSVEQEYQLSIGFLARISLQMECLAFLRIGSMQKPITTFTDSSVKDISLGIERETERLNQFCRERGDDIINRIDFMRNHVISLYGWIGFACSVEPELYEADVTEWIELLRRYAVCSHMHSIIFIKSYCKDSVESKENVKKIELPSNRSTGVSSWPLLKLNAALKHFKIGGIHLKPPHYTVKQAVPTNVKYTQYSSQMVPAFESNFYGLPIAIMQIPSCQRQIYRLESHKNAHIVVATFKHKLDIISVKDEHNDEETVWNCIGRLKYNLVFDKIDNIGQRMMQSSLLTSISHSYHCHVLRLYYKRYFTFPEHSPLSSTFCDIFTDYIGVGTGEVRRMVEEYLLSKMELGSKHPLTKALYKSMCSFMTESSVWGTLGQDNTNCTHLHTSTNHK